VIQFLHKQRLNFSCQSFQKTDRLSLVLWVAFFAYTTAVAILFQQIIVPLVPSMEASQGLFSADSLYFHKVAATLAETIIREGWQHWTPWPPPNAYGNVAVLAALYAIFGPDPALSIPVNAFLHASSGLLLFFIGRELFSGRAAYIASIVAACLFVVFPSGLNWYAQVHKDGYAIFGFLLIIYAGLKALRSEQTWFSAFYAIIVLLFGIGFTAFVRPNNFVLFLAMAAAMLFFSIFQFHRFSIKLFLQIVFATLIVASSILIPNSVPQAEWLPTQLKISDLELSKSGRTKELPANDKIFLERMPYWKWSVSKVLPGNIDHLAEKLSRVRLFMTSYGVQASAGSMIDIERMPENFSEFLQYLPRALIVGMFAPFPNDWFSGLSQAKLVGAFEVFILYLIFPGLLRLLWYQRKNLAMWWLLIPTLTILMAESYITANLGTLHRIRYPFIFVLILLGSIGWMQFLSPYWRKLRKTAVAGAPAPQPIENEGSISQHKVAGNQGVLVVLLTACVFVGLFARDLLLVKVLGLGRELDTFQLASFLPLFATALLAVPLGPVLIKMFLEIRVREGLSAAVDWVSATAMGVLVFFVVLSLFVGGVVWSGLFGSIPQDAMSPVSSLLPWLLPVVALSGSVVLGNSVLIASGFALKATWSQLAVPLVSLFLIGMWGTDLGAVAAAAGLMLGQMINYLVVAKTAKNIGFSIRPKFGDMRWKSWLGQYAPLMAASALTSAAIPVGVFMASKLPEGSVAAFSLGAKVIQFVTTLVSAALVAVVLPCFARLFAANRLAEARRSLQFLLSLGTVLALPFSFALFVLSGEIAAVLFQGGRVSFSDVEHLASVIRYGGLQFPFFVVLAILIKFTVAGGETRWVLFAAVLGQLVNLTAGSILMKQFDTAGLAMSMTIGMSVSSFLLLIWATFKNHMGVMASGLVAISWLLFFTLAVCVHFHNAPSTLACAFAFLALFVTEIIEGVKKRANGNETVPA